MLTFYPNYYKSFKCKADKCKHSCCCGWEIDIDDLTIKKYESIGGKIGEKLHKNIKKLPVPHFVLKQDGRCPFLDKKGLCELILVLGEEHLCDICRLHPRFVNSFSHHNEIGVGMCCEAAAELILSQKSTFRLVGAEDFESVSENYTEWEKELLEARNLILDIIFDAKLSINTVCKKLLNLVGIDELDISLNDIIKILLQAEIFDEAWKKLLEQALISSTDVENYVSEQKIRNLLGYLVFRHVSCSLDDFEKEENLVFCLVSTDIIIRLCNTYKNKVNVAEICRMYSAEIEYSTVNKEFIMEKIYDID